MKRQFQLRHEIISSNWMGRFVEMQSFLLPFILNYCEGVFLSFDVVSGKSLSSDEKCQEIFSPRLDIFISTVTVAQPHPTIHFSAQSIMSEEVFFFFLGEEKRSGKTCDRIFMRINGFSEHKQT